jgi:tetratricopeptide (TPR) repeat protein
MLLGHNYLARRDYHNAILQYQKALQFEDIDMPHHFLGRAYQALGQYPEAIKEFEKADLLSGKDEAEIRRSYDGLRKAFNEAGKEGYWQEQLARTAKKPDVDYYWKAVIQIQLDHKDQALDLLTKSLETDELLYSWCHRTDWLLVDEYWDGLKTDERFRRILEAAGQRSEGQPQFVDPTRSIGRGTALDE